MIKNLNKYRFIVLVASVITGISVSMGQGCSRFSASNGVTSASSTNGSTAAATAYMANTKTVGMVYGKQILSHFTSCLGSGLPSSLTLQTYTSKQGTISTNGSVATLTGPSLMATTSIAGEVCQDLITSEKTTQRIFVGFNLGGNTLPSTSQMSDAIQRIGRSCWARDPDSTEHQIIMDAISSSFTAAQAPNMTHDAALFMCTTMLSSLATLAL